MFCSSCGADIPEGSAFCVSCGAKLDIPVPVSQQQNDEHSLYSQSYNQLSYDQYGQPPKKNKPKTWMLVAGGAVLLLAIAAVLVFVVFGVSSGGWPLSGNTMQTRFVNDGVRVFSGAFADLSNKDMARLLTEPFDMEMDVDIDTGSFPMEATIAAAYDKELLGLKAEVLGQDVKLQLDEDTLYYSFYGAVGGYRFDTDADLSKPMALKDRIAALMESLPKDSASDVDYKLVAEAMVNSINEKCFDKGANETTLTLTPDDIIEMLDSLKDKAKEDKELKDQLKAMDFDIDEAIENMEQIKQSSEFDLQITISYDGGTPTGLEIDFDDGTEYGAVNLKFGYDKTAGGKDINLNIEANGAQTEVRLNIERNGRDVKFDGELQVSYGGTLDETYAIEGSESWDGEDVEGSVTITDNDGAQYGFDYDGTLAFGMPDEAVEDDSRFEIDKADAQVQDIEDALDYNLSGGLNTALPFS